MMKNLVHVLESLNRTAGTKITKPLARTSKLPFIVRSPLSQGRGGSGVFWGVSRPHPNRGILDVLG